MTADLLEGLCNSPCKETLEMLDISGTANFEEEKACQNLALLIDTITGLKSLNIDHQESTS